MGPPNIDKIMGRYNDFIGVDPNDLPLGTYVVVDMTPTKGQNKYKEDKRMFQVVRKSETQHKWHRLNPAPLVKDGVTIERENCTVRSGRSWRPRPMTAHAYGLGVPSQEHIDQLDAGSIILADVGFEYKPYELEEEQAGAEPSARFRLTRCKGKGDEYKWVKVPLE